MGQLRAGGRALNRPTWSPVKGSSASLPPIGLSYGWPTTIFRDPRNRLRHGRRASTRRNPGRDGDSDGGRLLIGAAPSNLWNHQGAAISSIRRHSSLGAPPHRRLWDRRNGSMRSLRVKKRYCAVKGLVPAGRSSRSRLFRRVLLRRVAVRGRSNGLILPSKFACCGNVSFDVPIASPSFVVPHPTPAPHGAEMA